jgi:hypothetical protein
MSESIREPEPFAFASGRYGDRPVFVLTRRWAGDDVGLTLYELSPADVARAHRERFADKNSSASLTLYDLSQAIVGEDSPAEIGDETSTHDWTGWKAIKITELKGIRCRTIINCLVRPTLDSEGYDSDIVCTGGDGSVALSESDGVRLSIAFRAMKPIRRQDRVRAVAEGIGDMSLGECYYWHAKMRSPTTPNGAKALRTLLSSHIE